MGDLNAYLNVKSKMLKLEGKVLQLSDEFVEGSIGENTKDDEVVLTMQYRDQNVDDEGPVQDDSEEIYEILKEKKLSAEYEVSPSYPVSERDENLFTPYITLFGKGLRPMIDRSS
jgi:hypothetical protein